jgi:hypothetical protein
MNENSTIETTSKKNGPRTPPGSPKIQRRGPRTPPGSPMAAKSSRSSDSTPPPPPDYDDDNYKPIKPNLLGLKISRVSSNESEYSYQEESDRDNITKARIDIAERYH